MRWIARDQEGAVNCYLSQVCLYKCDSCSKLGTRASSQSSTPPIRVQEMLRSLTLAHDFIHLQTKTLVPPVEMRRRSSCRNANPDTPLAETCPQLAWVTAPSGAGFLANLTQPSSSLVCAIRSQSHQYQCLHVGVRKKYTQYACTHTYRGGGRSGQAMS